MNIRQKVLTSFGILLTGIAIFGVMMLRQVDKLGRAVDVILRENYQSVIICQNVNEALERIDSGLLLSLSGQSAEPNFFTMQIDRINREWQAELHNITLPTEGERAEKVAKLLSEYIALLPRVNNPNTSTDERVANYREKVFPLFTGLKKEIGGILTINSFRKFAALSRETLCMRISLMIFIHSDAILWKKNSEISVFNPG